MSSNQFDQRILELVNEERAKAGVNPLEFDSRLDRAANLHNDEMVRADIMEHRVSGEAELGDRVRATGYNPSAWAENVAAGSETPEQVMNGWMNSPGHRSNILSPRYTDIGIGYEEAPDNRPYENGNTDGRDYDIYWTQVFGAGDDNDLAPQEPPADERKKPADEPEPAPEEQPVDEMDEPEPTPEDQPIDEMNKPEVNPEDQPIDEFDEPMDEPTEQPVDEGDNFGQILLDLFNAERAAAGLDLLEVDSQLDQAADLHTNEMVQADKLSHQLPGEASFGERVSATGYEWRGLGESVAGGFEDPQALVNALMDSPSNKANILNPNYTHLGTGYVEAPDDIAGDTDVYWTQVFGMEASNVS